MGEGDGDEEGEGVDGLAGQRPEAAMDDAAGLHSGAIVSRKRKRPAGFARGPSKIYPGDVLLSHTVARAVSLAMRSLTAVFGMGTGVSSAL